MNRIKKLRGKGGPPNTNTLAGGRGQGWRDQGQVTYM